MSDQPKPTTGEWTEWTGKRITNFLTQRSAKELAEEINATLAAEREKCDWLWSVIKQIEGGTDLISQIQQLRSQLEDACKVSQDSQRALWNATKQLAAAQASIRKHFHKDLIGDTTALDAAIEQKRLEIWAKAPYQPDIQEAVIKNLDLVHRHAIFAAQQPLVDALRETKSALNNGGFFTPIIDAALAKIGKHGTE